MNSSVSIALKANASNFVQGMDTATKAVNQVKGAMQFMARQANKVSDSLKKIGHKAVAMGVSLTATFGGAMLAAASFETTMRNVNSIMRGSQQEFLATGQAVINMTREIPVSMGTMAEGLYDIASSGFQGAAGLEVLEQSAIAATAGMSTVAVAAQGITGVLNAYGMAAADARMVSDVFFQTVNVGVLTFEQLVDGMGQWVGMAANLGVEVDDASAALATMTLSGIKADEASTALARTMQAFLKPSEAMAETTRQLGYESSLAMLQQEGLHGAMEKIGEVTGGDSIALSQLFLEVRGLNGAMALLANNGENYNDVYAQVTNSANRSGAAMRAFAEQSKSVSAKWQLFQNSLHAVGVEIGGYLLPAVGEVLDAATTIVNAFEHIPGPIKGAIAVFGALAGILLTVSGLILMSKIRMMAFQYVADMTGNTALGLVARWGQLGGTATFLAQKLNIVSMNAAGVQAATAKAAAGGGILATSLSYLGGAASSTSGTFARMAAALSSVRSSAAGFASTTAQAAGGISSMVSATVSGIPVIGGMVNWIRQHAAASVSAAAGSEAMATATTTATAAAGRGQAVIRGLAAAYNGLKTGLVNAGFAITALLFTYTTLDQANQSAKRHAEEFLSTLNDGFNRGTTQGLSDYNDALKSAEEQQIELTKANTDWQSMVVGAVQLMTPMKNEVNDQLVQHDQLQEELKRSAVQSSILGSSMTFLRQQTGLGTNAIEALAQEMDVDLAPSADDLAMILERGTGAALGYAAGEAARLQEEFVRAWQEMNNGVTTTSQLGEQLGALSDGLQSTDAEVLQLTDSQQKLHDAMMTVGDPAEGMRNMMDGIRQSAQDAGIEMDNVVLSMDQIIFAFAAQNAAVDDYETNVLAAQARLGSGGEAIVTYLSGLGQEGIDTIAAIADATPEQLDALKPQIETAMENSTNAGAIKLQGGMRVVEEAGREGGRLTADAIQEELRIGLDALEGIANDYAGVIAMGINPILESLGHATINLNPSSATNTNPLYGPGLLGPGQGNPVPNAAGGIYGGEDHTSTMANGGPMRVWNEPELPWEAYISGSPKHRDRNKEIIKEAARRMALDPFEFASGGFMSGADVPMPNARMTQGPAGPNRVGQKQYAALKNMHDQVAGWVDQQMMAGGAGLGGMPGVGMGMGWERQWNIVKAQFPNAQLISGFRPGARTRASNSVSYHARGRAIDISPRMDIFNWLAANYGRSTKELIFSPANGRQIYNGAPHMFTGVTRADHWDHVHWAMRRGGLVDGGTRQMTFDRGGMLPTGKTVAANNTGRGEHVFTAEQLSAMVGGNQVTLMNPKFYANSPADARANAKVMMAEIGKLTKAEA